MGLAHLELQRAVHTAIVQSEVRTSRDLDSSLGQPERSPLSVPWVSLVLCAVSILSTLILLMICFCVDRAKKHHHNRKAGNSNHAAAQRNLNKSIESIGSPSDLGYRTAANGDTSRSALYLMTPGSPESVPAMPMTQLSCESGATTFTRSCSLSTQRSRRIPSSWFPWLVDKVRLNSGGSAGGSGGSSSSNTAKRNSKITQSAADSLVAAAVEDYQFASMRKLSVAKNPVQRSVSLTGNPNYDSQMSRTSQHNRELPPVPSHEGSPSTQQGDNINATTMKTSLTISHSSARGEQENHPGPVPVPLADMESLATCDSQYDLLLGTHEAALMMLDMDEQLEMETAQLRTNALLCDCGCEDCSFAAAAAAVVDNGVGCRLAGSCDDASSSCDDVDPFYSTIRRKKAACRECGAGSVYTAGESSRRHSVISIEGELMNGRQCHAGTSTPSSHLYSQICRPNKQQEQQHATNEHQSKLALNKSSNTPQLLHYPLQTRGSVKRRQPIRSRTASSGDGMRPASSGPSLMRDGGLEVLARACMAPVVMSESTGGGEGLEEVTDSAAGSLWSVSASQTTGGGVGVAGPLPSLPSRGYGQSELDILHLLRGCDHEDPLLSHHHNIHQHHQQQHERLLSACHCAQHNNLGSIECPGMDGTPHHLLAAGTGGGGAAYQKRPSLHQFLLANGHRASQPALGSCSNLPILQPLCQLNHSTTAAVAHFRQNSYSDHQLAPINSCSPDADEDTQDRSIVPQLRHHQQPVRPFVTPDPESTTTTEDSDAPFSESLCQAEEEYAEIYEALDNLDIANDNSYSGRHDNRRVNSRDPDGVNNNNDTDLPRAVSSTVTPATPLAFIAKSRRLVGSGFGCGSSGGKTIFSLLNYRARMYSTTEGQLPDENDNPLSLKLLQSGLDCSKRTSDDPQLSPSILVEMKTFRHMDSDLDLSHQDPRQLPSSTLSVGNTPLHSRPTLIMSPLMERSMEGPPSSPSPLTTPPPLGNNNNDPMATMLTATSSASSGIGSSSRTTPADQATSLRNSTASSDMVMMCCNGDDSSSSASPLSSFSGCSASNSPLQQLQDPLAVTMATTATTISPPPPTGLSTSSSTSSPVNIFELATPRCPLVSATVGRSPQR